MLLSLNAPAQTPRDKSPAPLALTEAQRRDARIVEGLTLPSPGQFFVAMGKAGRPNWGPVGRIAIAMGSSERPQIALTIGLLLTDGYLAVETQNNQDMKNISRDVLDMARRLNVGEHVVARGRSLTDFADNNEWNSLREELEAAQNEVKISLSEQKDDPLAFLISLGSWLRMVQAGATLVSANYAPEPADLLQQGPLAGLYRERLEALPPRLLDNELIALIQQTLPEIETTMQPGEGATTLTPEAVESLTQLSTQVTSRIAGALPPAEVLVDSAAGSPQESPFEEKSKVEPTETSETSPEAVSEPTGDSPRESSQEAPQP